MGLINKQEYKKAVNAVKNGGLIAFPTETVYGLGVIYDNNEAYKRLISVKRRPPEKPFTLMLSDKEDMYKYGVIDNGAKRLIDKYVPGQFTLIVKAQPGLPEWAVSKNGTVGMRVPDDDFVRTMIREIGKPMLVPSANRSGEAPALTGEDVVKIFGNEIDEIIDGRSVGTVPSTVVCLHDNMAHILRAGNISEEEILKTLKEKYYENIYRK